MRILGLDYGSKRIGMAISDDLGITAQVFVTLQNKSVNYTIKEIRKICKEKQVEKIILGFPVNLEGEEGKQALEVKEFAKVLKQKIKLPVILEDERFTSSLAEKFLIKKEKGAKDQIAAQIILQDYLDKNL